MLCNTIIHTKTDRRIFIIIDQPEKLLLISNWKYNRPPDTSRVEEIMEYIQQSNNIDGIIYIAELYEPSDDGTCSIF